MLKSLTMLPDDANGMETPQALSLHDVRSFADESALSEPKQAGTYTSLVCTNTCPICRKESKTAGSKAMPDRSV